MDNMNDVAMWLQTRKAGLKIRYSKATYKVEVRKGDCFSRRQGTDLPEVVLDAMDAWDAWSNDGAGEDQAWAVTRRRVALAVGGSEWEEQR